MKIDQNRGNAVLPFTEYFCKIKKFKMFENSLKT